MNVEGNTIQSAIYGQDKKKKTKTTNLRTRSDLLTAPVIIHWLNLAGVETKALRDASGSPEVTGRKRQKQASSQDPLITSPTWGYFTLYAFLTPLESLWSSLRVKMYLKPISKFPTAYSMGKHTHRKCMLRLYWPQPQFSGLSRSSWYLGAQG